MSYRIPLPADDESEDSILKLPPAARVALIRALRELTPDELLEKGLSWDDIHQLDSIRESLT